MGMKSKFWKLVDLLIAILVMAIVLFGGSFTIGASLRLVRDLFVSGWRLGG